MTAVLQTAEHVDVTYEQLVLQSDPVRDGVAHTHRTATSTPRVWNLRWSVAHEGLFVAVHSLVETWGSGGAFAYTTPDSESVNAEMDEGSFSYRQHSAQRYEMSLTLREVGIVDN